MPARGIVVVLALSGLLGCSAPAAPAPAPPAASAPAAATTAPAQAAPGQAAAPTATVPAASSGPITLKVGANIGASDAGLFIGMERGYYAEQGLELDILPGSGSDQVAALATGELDVGAGAMNAGLLNAMSRELPLRIVADKGSTPPGFGYQAFVLRKDLADSGQVRTWADLRGRKIAAASVRSSVDFLLARGLGEVGLTIDDVEMVQIPYPNINAALANEAIDAAAFWEPLLTVGLDQGTLVRWKGADEIDPQQQSATLLYGPSFLTTNPDLGRRFMIAYVKGTRDYLDAFERGVDKENVIAALIKHTVVKDRAIYDRMDPAGFNRNGYADADDMEYQQDWYVQHGLEPVAIDIRQVVDNSFVDRALTVVGKQ